ncbi:MAG: alpha-D-glucose phosphate-specific phosphoglucomutase, partial [Oceanospirillales bacterium]
MLVNELTPLISAYFQLSPDASLSHQKVSFGTSGHRGSSLDGSFNQAHIWAITQAIAEYRQQQGIEGPLYLGIDTHALSIPAYGGVLEVLVANGVKVCVHPSEGYTPTPLISHAILQHNRQSDQMADGIVITPSHNPPRDGGIKYNTPDGGPAATEVTRAIQDRANEILLGGLKDIKKVSLTEAKASAVAFDFVDLYVSNLPKIIDIKAIERFGLIIGVDPLGGSSLEVWQAIAKRFSLHLTILNLKQDPTFAFMPKDHDGQIRMDCSSRHAMANLLSHAHGYDLLLANDPDADRHGIVDKQGLMNPNHYLAIAIDYLLQHRSNWSRDLSVGKTLVSSSLIDRVVARHDRTLFEVPVGFKWFVDGLHNGQLAFAGEESAGASLLDKEGLPWSTDKDGIVLCLLAAEIFAVTRLSPSQYYQKLTESLSKPFYTRVDAPASDDYKQAISSLSVEDIKTTSLAGDVIRQIHLKAPGNQQAIGGIKVMTDNGWFAARPSGTEALYKIYAESFVGSKHLEMLLAEAQQLIAEA